MGKEKNPNTPEIGDIQTPAVSDIQTPEIANKKIEVLCEKGEFGFGGQMYHHEHLDLETAEMLIAKGYPYLKIV